MHALAIEGTFDDCQALVKAMFNDLAFRDRMRLAGVNSINWARIVAQIVYYFVGGRGARQRRTGAVSFTVPTGNFGDVFAGYAARRMGLPIERLVIATNDNDILHRALANRRATSCAASSPTTSPSMDIQVSSNFERYLFEAAGRDAALRARQMGGLAAVRRLRARPRRSRAVRADFAAARADEADVADCIRAARKRRAAICSTRTPPAPSSRPRRRTRDPGTCRMVVLATAHPAKFPDAMQAITGERPALPPRLASLMTRPERIAVLPERSRRRPALRRGAEQVHASRSRRMSTQSTTLANGLRVVSHHMPHLETVSLGVWVAAGARHEQRAASTASRICSSTWPSRAPSGAPRPRSPRRSRRSAASSTPPPAWRRPPTSPAC